MMTNKQQQHQMLVYIGTYTEALPHVAGRGKGIYRCQLDLSTGALTPLDHTPNIVNPSYLVVDPTQQYLYAVQETDEGHNPAVFAFAIEPETGSLSFLNQQPAHGGLPCHIATDRTGRFVLTANYGTGSASVLPVLDNGQLRPVVAVVQHQGSGVNPARQEGPHAHAVVFDSTNRYVFIPDLGLDKIMIYRFDQSQGQLVPHEPPFCQLHAGAGPRHFVFHPNGQYAFVMNELDATVVVLAYNEENEEDEATLSPVQTISTLPSDFDGERSGSAIRVAPSGRFVYAANRGHDSIAIFAFDEATATLSPLGHESTQGQTPRDFALDPSGTFLLAANQDTDTIVTFRIDQQTGQLEQTGHVAHIPNPTCVAFVDSG